MEDAIRNEYFGLPPISPFYTGGLGRIGAQQTTKNFKHQSFYNLMRKQNEQPYMIEPELPSIANSAV